MSNEISLVKLMKDSADEDFIQRMSEKKVAVTKDKTNLLNAAKEYEKKYEKQINEGNDIKQLLIEDGRKKGFSKEEVVGKMERFIPAKDTPILNMLYFLMYEYKDIENDIKFLREDKDVGENFDSLKEILDKNIGNPNHKNIEQDIPDVLEYVYNKVTLDIFNTVKKLKSLSNSPVAAEAAKAFLKCRDLCKKYNLDIDKIPAYKSDQ